jgi:hypothetical protein
LITLFLMGSRSVPSISVPPTIATVWAKAGGAKSAARQSSRRSIRFPSADATGAVARMEGRCAPAASREPSGTSCADAALLMQRCRKQTRGRLGECPPMGVSGPVLRPESERRYEVESGLCANLHRTVLSPWSGIARQIGRNSTSLSSLVQLLIVKNAKVEACQRGVTNALGEVDVCTLRTAASADSARGTAPILNPLHY